MPETLITAAIIAVLAVICVIAVRSIIKRGKQGCCGAGGGAIAENIVKDTSGYSHSYSVKIGGMHCDKCASRIALAFNRQDGVFAKVSWKDGSAEILSENPLSELQIRSTIMGLDYTVEEFTDASKKQ